MHNMIVEDKRDLQNLDCDYEAYDGTPSISIFREQTSAFMESCKFTVELEIKVLQLQNDLVEHLWQKHGGQK